MGTWYFLQLILIKEYSCDIDAFFPFDREIFKKLSICKGKKNYICNLE